MPKVTEAHTQARRAQILSAAAACFSRDGFHETTIRAICEEAGLSQGAVYGYFKSKDDIIEAMAEMGRQHTGDVLKSGGSPDSSLQVLVQKMGAAVDHLASDEAHASNRLSLRLWGEGLSTPRIRDLFHLSLNDLVEPLADEVRRGQQLGEITAHLDPDSVARVLAAIGLGFTVQAALEPRADFDGESEVISSLLDGTFTTRGSER